jgi:hypothetical protein
MPEDVSPKEAPPSAAEKTQHSDGDKAAPEPASPAPSPAAPSLIDQAEAAHRAGRFAEVRALLKQLRAQAPRLTDAERQRVDALVARLRPDPLAAILLVGCLLLFALVIARYWN